MPKLTINGKEVEVEKGKNLLPGVLGGV